MAEFDISVTHPEYDEYECEWETMRCVVEGEDEVKEEGEKYLPMKSGMKAMSDERRKQEAYKAYKDRAEFPEIVQPTVHGSVGLITSTAPQIEVPSGLEYLKEKATRDGLTLEGLHQRVTMEVMRMGRYGLMPGITDAGEFYIAGYCAESIRNWATDGGNLSYLVLDETSEIRDPLTNKWVKDNRYRECFLNEQNAFTSREWIKVRDENTGKERWIIDDGTETVAMIRGQQGLGMIPMTFVGSTDLTPDPDDVPLYGLAKLALRAYRIDADYQNALHMTAEPTPWAAGVDKEEAPKTIGAQAMWVFSSENAKVGFLEFSGPGIEAQQKAIADTLERAIVYGAQLFSDTTKTKESGEAIKLRLGSQQATIRSIAITVAAGLEQCLKNVAVWAGYEPDEVSVTPNLDFIERYLSPQEVDSLVRGWQAGAYSKETLFFNLQRGEVIPSERTYEQEQELIDQNGPQLTGNPLNLGG